MQGGNFPPCTSSRSVADCGAFRASNVLGTSNQERLQSARHRHRCKQNQSTLSEALLVSSCRSNADSYLFLRQKAANAPSCLPRRQLAVLPEFVLEVLAQAVSESCLTCNMCCTFKFLNRRVNFQEVMMTTPAMVIPALSSATARGKPAIALSACLLILLLMLR